MTVQPHIIGKDEYSEYFCHIEEEALIIESENTKLVPLKVYLDSDVVVIEMGNRSGVSVARIKGESENWLNPDMTDVKAKINTVIHFAILAVQTYEKGTERTIAVKIQNTLQNFLNYN